MGGLAESQLLGYARCGTDQEAIDSKAIRKLISCLCSEFPGKIEAKKYAIGNNYYWEVHLNGQNDRRPKQIIEGTIHVAEKKGFFQEWITDQFRDWFPAKKCAMTFVDCCARRL